MNKIEYLDYLYYKIGKQTCNFELQIQNQDKFMSKRRDYLSTFSDGNAFWLDKANARTLLFNEIVFDFDPEKGESEQKFFERMKLNIYKILEYNWTYWGLFQSNRGLHLHCFSNRLFLMTPSERKDYRQKLLSTFGADVQKASDKITIALEFAHHWKSGKPKEYIKGILFGETNG